ncbi:hypothetical protein AJ79_06931 [Helicocarpus griseus UAMH5409]|uniref:Uncharacterized protein n=1 Tax=Helicocarpus griseus UAMH5409 TaxID=1447875 RepID=A0A2B7X040_9EURO|nr:hypothetical protein AJ79_06931 [Helicocarpus griseus UAMH5409]
MTEEGRIREKKARYKLLFRSSRESYSDDNSDTNRTPVASVQDDEEVLYEIDPRALEKLPERLQNNYRELFQERAERLSMKNPNFKLRQYDYMDYWPEEAFKTAEEEQPRVNKRRYPKKHKVLWELGINPASQLQSGGEKGAFRVMNPDPAPALEKGDTMARGCEAADISPAKKLLNRTFAMLPSVLNSPAEKELHPVYGLGNRDRFPGFEEIQKPAIQQRKDSSLKWSYLSNRGYFWTGRHRVKRWLSV